MFGTVHDVFRGYLVCGGISFYPHTRPGGWRGSNVQLGSACARVQVCYLVSSVVVVGVGDRPPFSDLGCALRHRPAHVLFKVKTNAHGTKSWNHEKTTRLITFFQPSAPIRARLHAQLKNGLWHCAETVFKSGIALRYTWGRRQAGVLWGQSAERAG